MEILSNRFEALTQKLVGTHILAEKLEKVVEEGKETLSGDEDFILKHYKSPKIYVDFLEHFNHCDRGTGRTEVF
jgi:hypothetical protein